ncbi:MAG TPA: N(5)-(carboxyethyl)ornithine synthase [Actinomycetota bacterium]|nr:N(5)-(carboxyethyl)ornithine synthase [Actinomycetota bacterium]
MAGSDDGRSLKLGVFGTSRKENERRLPIHPLHLAGIDPALRSSIFVEEGYGGAFGTTKDQLDALVAGVRTQEQLIEECDVLLLPKPLADDLAQMRAGQVLWGWPHCVQDEELTQQAIDRRLTLIAWEAMNRWSPDGKFDVHVFHKNNEIAGYASVLHALTLVGRTGHYGRGLRAIVISYGATGRGAVTALNALGIVDVTVVTGRDPAAVPSPPHAATMGQFGSAADDPDLVVAVVDGDRRPMADVLAEHDVVVNCVLQDTDSPYMFVTYEDLAKIEPGSLIVDVSCDTGMGFEWARPTSFEDPMFTVGDNVGYYAVDHSPAHLWDSATWEISEALLPYLPVVLGGPGEWARDETIGRAIEIRDGVVQNPKILSFQHRAAEYPHERQE